MGWVKDRPPPGAIVVSSSCYKPVQDERSEASTILGKLLRHMRELTCNDFDDEYHHVYSSLQPDRPTPGTIKLALNVSKFGKDDWLDHSLSGSARSTRRWGDSDWCLAYHGTDGGNTSVLLGILRHGLKKRGGGKSARVGAKWGEGVYVSPDPSVAFTYCDDPLRLDGKAFHVIFECRVRAGKYQKTFDQRESWIVKHEEDVRVCAMLLLDSTNVKCRHGKFWVNCCLPFLKEKLANRAAKEAKEAAKERQRSRSRRRSRSSPRYKCSRSRSSRSRKKRSRSRKRSRSWSSRSRKKRSKSRKRSRSRSSRSRRKCSKSRKKRSRSRSSRSRKKCSRSRSSRPRKRSKSRKLITISSSSSSSSS